MQLIDKLGNYENTITLTSPSYLKQGNDKDVAINY